MFGDPEFVFYIAKEEIDPKSLERAAKNPGSEKIGATYTFYRMTTDEHAELLKLGEGERGMFLAGRQQIMLGLNAGEFEILRDGRMRAIQQGDTLTQKEWNALDAMINNPAGNMNEPLSKPSPVKR